MNTGTLEARGLVKDFRLRSGMRTTTLHAVKGASFVLEAGKILADVTPRQLFSDRALCDRTRLRPPQIAVHVAPDLRAGFRRRCMGAGRKRREGDQQGRPERQTRSFVKRTPPGIPVRQ